MSENADSNETLLFGGRFKKGVVRVGTTVRRPAGRASAFVAQLLKHLEAQEVSWAPRYLGRDDLKRDIFTYIPGSVQARWCYLQDHQIKGAGRLLRAFHNATRGSALAGESPVICHNDFGPNNAVFEGDEPVALIDFDMARPGEPIEDLGYTAWAWCVSSRPDRQLVSTQAHQVRVLIEAYGGLDVWRSRELVDAIAKRQEQNIMFWLEVMSHPDDVAMPAEKIVEVIAWSRRELAYTLAHRQQFEAALEGSLGRSKL